MCQEEDCTKEVHAKGLCQAHYRQAKRRERGLKKPGPARDPSKPYSKFREPVVREPKAPKTHCPAGHAYDEENTYVDARGARHCKACRRDRMSVRRPATGIGTGGKNAAKTHCPKGHPYDDENTFVWKGKRHCRTCARINSWIQTIKKYGISVEQYLAMDDAQGGLCLICKRDPSPDRLVVDHDHSCCPETTSCGKCVRGLLCSRCNSGIGHFQDNVEWLLSAADYLRRNDSPYS